MAVVFPSPRRWLRKPLERNDNMDNVTIILGDALTELAKLPICCWRFFPCRDHPAIAGNVRRHSAGPTGRPTRRQAHLRQLSVLHRLVPAVILRAAGAVGGSVRDVRLARGEETMTTILLLALALVVVFLMAACAVGTGDGE